MTSLRTKGATAIGLAAALAALVISHSTHSQEHRQPEVVCDLTIIQAGSVEGEGPKPVSNGDRLRLTFRDLDAKAGSGKMLFGDGASGEEFVAMTVDASAITYLHERDRVSKMIVTTANKPSPLGWAAVMSQHGSSEGRLTIRTAIGHCRMRAR